MEVKKLTSGELMDRIIQALDEKTPLSVISIGSTESYVMSQYTVMSEKQFMQHKEAIVTNSGVMKRGFKFPNVKLRDEMVEATKKADIIGYNISLLDIYAGKMVPKVFRTYDIQPQFIFESLVRRVIPFNQKVKFKQMLRNRRTVLIGSNAPDVKQALERRWGKRFPFKIVASIPMRSYDEMEEVKKSLDAIPFDLALISAGVNAVILAPYIAKHYGKVAFDLGQGMNSLITKQVQQTGFVQKIGLQNLMEM
ncbi:GT-D fold domain-containing glycosyltransferase [Cohnella sp. WQ 127256]|uniref:GT-D fold domain-containing glycosyltransferase n=1 Tax=Cohnella sp. WQ 127256 TaxID=2938790 RepID=UPI002118B771|nr:GT-D fold domain-containing glycosyltransferase [Cohnella sp. WQ 127256]